MKKKINVGVVFGGKSVEHEVSLQSAQNVINALSREKYNLFLIGIDIEGKWHLYDEKNYLKNAENPKEIALGVKLREVDLQKEKDLDVIFPILHGTYGEDGVIQGFCKLVNIPFVGASILASSIGMDKDVMKRLIRDANIPTAKWVCIQKHEKHLWSFEKVQKIFSPPFFIKPCNSGSSIGISKVTTSTDFQKALELAFHYDRKVIIEEAIEGIETQCGILGNEHPIISLPCQIIPKGDFHSYASKYLDDAGAEFVIPASLAKEELSLVQTTALKAYKILCCEGMARVDLFLTKKGEVFFNEINTIPGLTSKSPFSKMWEATGLSYSEILNRLIHLALERHRKEEKLETKITLSKESFSLI